jgi:alpha-galactosidase/6-phospho-beta-glucosidase family protein
MEGACALALKVLALHPLVPSYEMAKMILDDDIARPGDDFPTLR